MLYFYHFHLLTKLWVFSCFLYNMSLKVKVKSLSRVQLFATPWTVAYQASPSMWFSRQEYWSGLPFPSPGDLPDPGIKPRSPALQADALTSEPPGKPYNMSLVAFFWSQVSHLHNNLVPSHILFSCLICQAIPCSFALTWKSTNLHFSPDTYILGVLAYMLLSLCLFLLLN